MVLSGEQIFGMFYGTTKQDKFRLKVSCLTKIKIFSEIYKFQLKKLIVKH